MSRLLLPRGREIVHGQLVKGTASVVQRSNATMRQWIEPLSTTEVLIRTAATINTNSEEVVRSEGWPTSYACR